MLSKFKIEIAIGSLLLLTLAVTLGNQYIDRSCELTTSDVEYVDEIDDRIVGGTSQASGEILDDSCKFNYRVDATDHTNAFAQLGLFPHEHFHRDMSWVSRFEVEIRSNRPEGEEVTFFVRDFEPMVSVEGDSATYKCNEALINLSDTMETVTVHRDEFIVPSWWKKRFGAKGDAAFPSFKNIRMFEFNVSNDGSGEIEIGTIRCVGNWVNSATLSQILLWIWMGGILVAIVYRMLRLNKKLSEKTASATQLMAYNNILISESATFHELARRDPLTGLFNRYGLETEFEQLSSKYCFDYSMILFDLDKFKEINDSLGHIHGDRVLFDVATIVKSKLSSRDIAARWGGDEFLVILHGSSAKEASEFTEEIRRSISASDLIYSCSFGICASELGQDFKSVFSNADSALYDSKNSGRNKTSSYRAKGGRRAADFDTAVVPEITLLPNDLPIGEFSIYE